jgi:hypothetical protein
MHRNTEISPLQLSRGCLLPGCGYSVILHGELVQNDSEDVPILVVEGQCRGLGFFPIQEDQDHMMSTVGTLYPRVIPLPRCECREFVDPGVVPSGNKQTSPPPIDVPDSVSM